MTINDYKLNEVICDGMRGLNSTGLSTALGFSIMRIVCIFHRALVKILAGESDSPNPISTIYHPVILGKL